MPVKVKIRQSQYCIYLPPDLPITGPPPIFRQMVVSPKMWCLGLMKQLISTSLGLSHKLAGQIFSPCGSPSGTLAWLTPADPFPKQTYAADQQVEFAASSQCSGTPAWPEPFPQLTSMADFMGRYLGATKAMTSFGPVIRITQLGSGTKCARKLVVDPFHNNSSRTVSPLAFLKNTEITI